MGYEGENEWWGERGGVYMDEIWLHITILSYIWYTKDSCYVF